MNEKIIKVAATNLPSSGDKGIPTWVKTHAIFWTDGQMSDSEFLEGIKFLINEGIIKLKQQDSHTSISFESENLSINSNFSVKITDDTANTDSELIDIVNLTLTDGGPIQAGTTIIQHVIASETGVDSGVFTFTGTVSDFVSIPGELYAIYETESKTYEIFTFTDVCI